MPPGPLLLILVSIPLASTLALGAASAADPSRTPLRLDASQARSAGQLIDLRRHAELPAPLVEVADPGGLIPLAITADGSMVAFADRPGLDPAILVVASVDGSQLRVPMDGLVGAAFAPDGSWLAASDGTGRLWKVPLDGAPPALVADGPYAGSMVVEPEGSILALAVASVEAPFTARLVRVDAGGGATAPLVDEELVYDVHLIDEGGLAVVAHRPDGTVVESLRDGSLHAVAALGAGAVNVSVSSDLRTIAWERAGEIYVRSDAGERHVATGMRPRVSANGSMVTLETTEGGRVVAPDGTLLAMLAGTALLPPCGECRP